MPHRSLKANAQSNIQDRRSQLKVTGLLGDLVTKPQLRQSLEYQDETKTDIYHTVRH